MEQRRHERLSLGHHSKTVVLDTGETLECEVIDVSISGASLRMDMRPPVGMGLMLGRLRGRVMRHHEQASASSSSTFRNRRLCAAFHVTAESIRNVRVRAGTRARQKDKSLIKCRASHSGDNEDFTLV